MSEYLRPEYTPLFREVQETIAGYLNSDPQISAKQIEFIPEARLDIDFQVKKALGQQGIVGVVNTMKGEFAGHDGSTNAWQVEAEVDVIENPPVRRAQLRKMGLETGTVSDILDWVQESMCGPSSPTFARFSPVSQEIGEDKGLVVGRSIMRSVVIADVSAVISGGNQWKCPYALLQDLSALSTQVQEIEYDVSGKADLSALDKYLPLSGGTMTGSIEFSLDDIDPETGYRLVRLNPTGENWNVLFAVDDGNGQPYVAHNGSESGGGEAYQYPWKLSFPDESGTLATREWSQGAIDGKADLSALDKYLPLSGGTMTGNLVIDRRQIQLKNFDGTTPLIYPSPGMGMSIEVPDYNDPQKFRRYVFTGTDDYISKDRVAQFTDLSAKADLSALSAMYNSLPYSLLATESGMAFQIPKEWFPMAFSYNGVSYSVPLSDYGLIQLSQDIPWQVSYVEGAADIKLMEFLDDGTFDFQYVDSITLDGAAPDSSTALKQVLTYPIADRAINNMTVPSSGAASLEFPEPTDGKARDFVIRITIGAGASVDFPDTVKYETEGGEWPDFSEAGTYIVRFTEVVAASGNIPARFLMQTSKVAVAGGGE